MTNDVHDHTRTGTAGSPPVGRSRPRWLLLVVIVVAVVGSLVLTGVVSASTVLSVGLIGGMLLMHLGGHGGHGGSRTSDTDAGDEARAQPGSRGCH